MASGQLKVVNSKNKEVGKVEVDTSIFNAKFNQSLLHDYVVMQRRGWRQGTHSTKTRAEVSGTGKKPFRQKGTGNARQGTLIGPHQPGGGIAFGPKPRDYTTMMNKKSKREALRVALSQKNYEGKLSVLDAFEVASGKAKEAFQILTPFSAKGSILVVGKLSDATKRSIRNLVKIKVLEPEALNVYDLLKHDQVLITKDAIQELQTKLKKAA